MVVGGLVTTASSQRAAGAAGDGAPRPPDEAGPKAKLALPTGDDKPKRTRPRPEKLEREVVGFVLRGPRRWHKLEVLDMESIRDANKRRYLPLLRVLRWLDVKATEADSKVTFRPEGQGPAVLDLETQTLNIAGLNLRCSLIVTASEITRRRDIFIDVDILAAVLGFQLEWDDVEYEFHAKTQRELRVWRRMRGKSLMAILATEPPANLPEVLGPAKVPENSLDFLRLKGRVQYQGRFRPDYDDVHDGSISSLEQAIWGGWRGGDYKFRFTEPTFRVDRQGERFDRGSPVAMGWGQWTYRDERTELAIGDSTFGLNNITLPSVSLSGLRVNGFTGREYDRNLAATEYGLRARFINPRIFEGHARVGSEVELQINDYLVETQQILADSPTRPGYGRYRFEDIMLTPGILHKIRIVIRDPDGVETVLERDIMGSADLLREGEATYLLAIGSHRETTTWDAHGVIMTGRYLHGLDDTVTAGATFAIQEGFYRDRRTIDRAPDPRDMPARGGNFGLQGTWQADKSLIFATDLAASQGEADGRHTGFAGKMSADFSPVRELRIHSQVFRYSPEFFNGTNIELRDRNGFLVFSRWQVHKRWRLQGFVGSVRDNLDGRLDQTARMDFHSARITTSVIPKTTVTAETDRYTPNWDNGASVFYTLKVRSTPLPDTIVDAEISGGDNTDLDEYDDLLNGLRLPGIRTSRARQTAVKVTRRLSARSALGAAYRWTTSKDKPTVFHSFQTKGKNRLQLWTEAGQERYRSDRAQYAFFENRLEYLFDETGRCRAGLRTLHQRGQWSAQLFLNVESLFANTDGSLRRITDRRIIPDRGAIHGVVFLDRNANARIDPGETGIQDITVRLGRYYKSVTDADGRFMLPALGSLKQLRVSVDLDTIPAIYTVVHGTQLLNIRPRRITHIRFALTPMISLSGKIVAPNAQGKQRPLAGVRLYLVTADGKEVGTDSITALDGTYYIGEVRPGSYELCVDPSTLPENVDLAEQRRPVTVAPATEEFAEITLEPFVGRYKKEDKGAKPNQP